MVEVVSQADIAYQDEVWIGRGIDEDPIAFTQVLGIETVSMPEKTPEEIDVTHMQSPGRTRETIPGLMSAADWSQELQHWPEHASQVLLDTLAGLTETGAHEDVYVEFNVGGIRRTYRGYVNSFIPNGSVREKRTATLSMKIFERLATNPRPLNP